MPGKSAKELRGVLWKEDREREGKKQAMKENFPDLKMIKDFIWKSPVSN